MIYSKVEVLEKGEEYGSHSINKIEFTDSSVNFSGDFLIITKKETKEDEPITHTSRVFNLKT